MYWEYQLLPGFKLKTNTNCHIVEETMTVSYNYVGTLIIDRNVLEGRVRYKYLLQR